MMNDDSYDPYQQNMSPNRGRWLVFVVALVFGVVGIYGIIISTPIEMVFLYTFLYVPIVVFLLYATLRWAQGRSIAPTDISEDDRILSSMRKHALPVQTESLSGMLHCGNCGADFDIVNATPIEKDVYLCPHCKTRLHIQ
jgi:DNA-directed RNA polymerase subunit RPC12/RpoP